MDHPDVETKSFHSPTDQEKETIWEASSRIPELSVKGQESHALELCGGLVAYVQQGNFTIALLKCADGLRVGVTKRSMGGMKRRKILSVVVARGEQPEFSKDWEYYEVPPDEKDEERAQRIALSRAAKAEPIKGE